MPARQRARCISAATWSICGSAWTRIWCIYPVKGGESHQHRRHRATDEWNETGWQAEGDRAEILRHFARFSWAENVRALIGIPDRWLKWALYDRGAPFAGAAVRSR